jgi:hypothetical protein
VGGGLLGWSAANSAAYGVFTVSDFSSGAFADAYGAMTRIEHENWNPKVAVPADVRAQLTEQVPSFAELAAILDSDWYTGRYAATGDYQSGAFYWALREAAAELGHYDSPEASRQFWASMAGEINALCDDGTFAAGGPRSSVSPPIRAEYVGPVLAEGLYSLWFCATFAQCEPEPIFSPHSNDAAFYESTIRPMEAFLHNRAQTATLENSTEPYLDMGQRISFGLLGAIRWVYALLLPLGFLAGLAASAAGAVRFIKRVRAKRRDSRETLEWLVGLGLLGVILLRAFMVAFVTVSSYEIGTFVMYLAPIHPVMVLVAALGVCHWARWAGARKGKQGETV